MNKLIDSYRATSQKSYYIDINFCPTYQGFTIDSAQGDSLHMFFKWILFVSGAAGFVWIRKG